MNIQLVALPLRKGKIIERRTYNVFIVIVLLMDIISYMNTEYLECYNMCVLWYR